jgi:D-glycero-alpha-D-manno-heptose-7-phosphate kinase
MLKKTNIKKNIVITKTPLRISFFGGGTDFKQFFKNKQGLTISTSINKYIYVTAKRHGELFKEKYRLNYSNTEIKNSWDTIKNEITKACIKFTNTKPPIYISTISDMPTSSGLGSSSSFTVGLLHALYKLNGIKINKNKLAYDAAKIEINILKKPIGYQDQFIASYGGFRVITYYKNKIKVIKVKISQSNLEKIFSNIFLVWTKIQRDSSSVLTHQLNNLDKNQKYLNDIKKIAQQFLSGIKKNINIKNLSFLLDKSWKVKKNLSKKISNKKIDLIYSRFLNLGVKGGKLLGAGGGGFFLLVSNKKIKNKLKIKLKKNEIIDIKPDKNGSKTIYSE